MSENVLDLLREKDITWGADTLDNAINFKEVFEKRPIIGAAAEKFDNTAFKMTLTGLNNLASGYVPDEYKDEIQLALDDVQDGDKDYTEAGKQVFDICGQINEKMDSEDTIPDVASKVVKLVLTSIEFFVLTWLEGKALES